MSGAKRLSVPHVTTASVWATSRFRVISLLGLAARLEQQVSTISLRSVADSFCDRRVSHLWELRIILVGEFGYMFVIREAGVAC